MIVLNVIDLPSYMCMYLFIRAAIFTVLNIFIIPSCKKAASQLEALLEIFLTEMDFYHFLVIHAQL